MEAKNLKNWVDSLPDDALIQATAATHMSIPLRGFVLTAIERKSIKFVDKDKLFCSGKVISSIDDNEKVKVIEVDTNECNCPSPRYITNVCGHSICNKCGNKVYT